MKKFLALTLMTSTLALGLASTGASAATVKGKVDTNVKVGAVIQQNTGIANKNEVNLGSVSGKRSHVGGDFKSRVKVGAIIQKNTGIANKNEVNLGSVTD